MYEKKPLTKSNLNFINELIKQNERLNEELSQLKSTLKSKNKASKQAKNIPLRFYLNDKTTRLVKKCIKKLIQINPISGWFVYILSITGCRGVEIQNVRLSDVFKETSCDGEVFYSLRVNVAKKRSSY
ncbi:Integrase protein family protein (plasmid) [Borrelia nietonii YOR]|uniref:Integrase protein family protein n=1 Tax=Borrelia nietonii YOR TaxID=1293576 RepID=W5SH27_9SPIR|nr:hypothetical protein [Borrelia nietonii]AHH04391.1 Integrase protein family protein [Borrelia nietonii YOR]UPA09994.1 hypothetical protein bhYOR_001324 [Borrelia nietonii YOR]